MGPAAWDLVLTVETDNRDYSETRHSLDIVFDLGFPFAHVAIIVDFRNFLENVPILGDRTVVVARKTVAEFGSVEDCRNRPGYIPL